MEAHESPRTPLEDLWGFKTLKRRAARFNFISMLLMFAWSIVLSIDRLPFGDGSYKTIWSKYIWSWPGAFASFGLGIASGILHGVAFGASISKKIKHCNGAPTTRKEHAQGILFWSLLGFACSASCWSFYAPLCFMENSGLLCFSYPLRFGYDRIGIVIAANVTSLIAVLVACDIISRLPESQKDLIELRKNLFRGTVGGSSLICATGNVFVIFAWPLILILSVSTGNKPASPRWVIAFVLAIISALSSLLCVPPLHRLQQRHRWRWDLCTVEVEKAGAYMCCSMIAWCSSIAPWCFWSADQGPDGELIGAPLCMPLFATITTTTTMLFAHVLYQKALHEQEERGGGRGFTGNAIFTTGANASLSQGLVNNQGMVNNQALYNEVWGQPQVEAQPRPIAPNNEPQTVVPIVVEGTTVGGRESVGMSPGWTPVD